MGAKINVYNEIGKLKKVLLHRPGTELEQLSPNSLEDLLFDDIPYLEVARQEHDTFAEALRDQGVEVVYLTDLAAEAIKAYSPSKTAFANELIEQAGGVAQFYAENHGLREYLISKSEPELVAQAISGFSVSDFGADKDELSRLLGEDSEYILPPMPNLYFTRDPFASVGGGVVHSKMNRPIRHRETIFSKFIFDHHPDFADKMKFYYKSRWPFSIEGGDILNLSSKVVAVGHSLRTSAKAIELFAKNLFADPESTAETVLVFEIPRVRAYMHLDTVFTQVDHDKFTIYAGIQKDMHVCALNKTRATGEFTIDAYTAPLDEVLAKYLGLPKVKLINCGGLDSVSSAREQWNDAANTLAVAPGVVICYNRNGITNRRLREEGITVIEIPSSELSRGRGGPRCMSMPLYRD
ncbi:MAG: arginine deiminase [Defluviitaleaceae bacterium]|nr:arginine deiminase [Defluviitaleaceae bacterium]